MLGSATLQEFFQTLGGTAALVLLRHGALTCSNIKQGKQGLAIFNDKRGAIWGTPTSKEEASSIKGLGKSYKVDSCVPPLAHASRKLYSQDLTHATYGLHPKMLLSYVPHNAIPNVTPNTTCDVPLSSTSETMKQRG